MRAPWTEDKVTHIVGAILPREGSDCLRIDGAELFMCESDALERVQQRASDNPKVTYMVFSRVNKVVGHVKVDITQ